MTINIYNPLKEGFLLLISKEFPLLRQAHSSIKGIFFLKCWQFLFLTKRNVILPSDHNLDPPNSNLLCGVLAACCVESHHVIPLHTKFPLNTSPATPSCSYGTHGTYGNQ
jgi:hypothetical protein